MPFSLTEEGWSAEENDVGLDEGWNAEEDEFCETVPEKPKPQKKAHNAMPLYYYDLYSSLFAR
jgi:hypothetical protein